MRKSSNTYSIYWSLTSWSESNIWNLYISSNWLLPEWKNWCVASVLKKTCVPGHIPSTRSKCSHDHSPYTPHVFHWFIFILPSYQISVISRLEEMYELQIPLNRCQIFLKMRLLFAACCQTAFCYRCSPTKSRPLLTNLNRQKRNSPSERAAFGRWC